MFRDLWKELVVAGPTNDDLCYIIEYVEPLRGEAWKQFLAHQPTNDDLRYIIRYVEPLRGEAGKLLKRERSEIMQDIKRLA